MRSELSLPRRRNQHARRFSRKGFDSSAGGCASPIIGGVPCSLPIPARTPTGTRYRDLAPGTADLVGDLTGGRYGPDSPCHLDPDLDPRALGQDRPRPDGWRGAFGQVGAAQAHLSNRGIGPGDLFLFWGLFRPAARDRGGRWRFVGPPEHALFGWLQVDEVVALGADGGHALAGRPWLADHPHVRAGWPINNALYLGRERLVLDGGPLARAGFGRFARRVRLTAPGSARPSVWEVPDWLDPARGGVGLTYHPPARWPGGGRLSAAPRGQEFVADVTGRDDALAWLRRLFEETP